jgi:hypothetical protein
MTQRDRPHRPSEADRYKSAATDALRLVDWCIEYLAENHQGRIARQLALNRKHIGWRLGERRPRP